MPGGLLFAVTPFLICLYQQKVLIDNIDIYDLQYR